MSYTVCRRSGEGVLLDFYEIVLAIKEAIDSTMPILEENAQKEKSAITVFTGTLGEYSIRRADGFCQDGITIFHRLAHFILHCIYNAGKYFISIISFTPRYAATYSNRLIAIVKILTMTFLEHTSVSRRITTLRRQDRGSTESVSDDDDNITFFITNTLVLI